MYILPSRMDSSCAMNYCYLLFAYIIVYYCGSNHTELMTAYGLILALVLPCCSSRFDRVEPHRTHASLWPDTCSSSAMLLKQVR